jgi:hypothetical protein
MMNKKFLLGWLVVFVVWMLGSFLVHAVLLSADYMKTPQLYRTEADAGPLFPLMILAHVVLAGAFVWIYSRGVEAKPWLAQGLRFGFVVALLTTVPTYTIYFVVQPVPGMVAVKQIVFDGLLTILLGAIAAFCYRGARTA